MKYEGSRMTWLKLTFMSKDQDDLKTPGVEEEMKPSQQSYSKDTDPEQTAEVILASLHASRYKGQ